MGIWVFLWASQTKVFSYVWPRFWFHEWNWNTRKKIIEMQFTTPCRVMFISIQKTSFFKYLLVHKDEWHMWCNRQQQCGLHFHRNKLKALFPFRGKRGKRPCSSMSLRAFPEAPKGQNSSSNPTLHWDLCRVKEYNISSIITFTDS